MIRYTTSVEYELKTGEGTPFDPDKWYVYLNGDMFQQVSGPTQGLEVIMRDDQFMRELLLIHLNLRADERNSSRKPRTVGDKK